MYIKNPVRRAVAAAALATSAAIAVGAVAARADSSITPDSGSIDTATGRAAGDAPPGSGLAGEAGMGVTLDRQYEVVDGDSFWGIAERQLPDDATAGDVLKVTTALMAHNAPRLGYGDPAMLRPGDVVDIGSAAPVPAAAQTARPGRDEASVAPASHEAVAGDSYWAIAESTLGDEATPADVLEKTEALIALNSPRLGYEDAQMLHPGDVVYLEDPASTEVAIERGSSAEAADPKVADKNVSKPAKTTTSMPSALPKITDGTTTWNWPLATQYRAERRQTPTSPPWNWPLATQYRAERRQTPTSPPLSELALISSETISPLQPATAGREPIGQRTAAPNHASAS
jgi:hypothetical protein